MGAIKEFYHEEICAMQNGEDFDIDDAYMEAKWQKHLDEAAEVVVKDREKKMIEINNSAVPKFLHLTY